MWCCGGGDMLRVSERWFLSAVQVGTSDDEVERWICRGRREAWVEGGDCEIYRQERWEGGRRAFITIEASTAATPCCACNTRLRMPPSPRGSIHVIVPWRLSEPSHIASNDVVASRGGGAHVIHRAGGSPHAENSGRAWVVLMPACGVDFLQSLLVPVALLPRRWRLPSDRAARAVNSLRPLALVGGDTYLPACIALTNSAKCATMPVAFGRWWMRLRLYWPIRAARGGNGEWEAALGGGR